MTTFSGSSICILPNIGVQKVQTFQKIDPLVMTSVLKLSSYLLPKFSRVTFTIVLIPLISTMVNGTLLNIGMRYEDDLRVIFDQWPKLHLGLDALSNQKILNGIY